MRVLTVKVKVCQLCGTSFFEGVVDVKVHLFSNLVGFSTLNNIVIDMAKFIVQVTLLIFCLCDIRNVNDKLRSLFQPVELSPL